MSNDYRVLTFPMSVFGEILNNELIAKYAQAAEQEKQHIEKAYMAYQKLIKED